MLLYYARNYSLRLDATVLRKELLTEVGCYFTTTVRLGWPNLQTCQGSHDRDTANVEVVQAHCKGDGMPANASITFHGYAESQPRNCPRVPTSNGTMRSYLMQKTITKKSRDTVP